VRAPAPRVAEFALNPRFDSPGLTDGCGGVGEVGGVVVVVIGGVVVVVVLG
jgi:hypothetical protein